MFSDIGQRAFIGRRNAPRSEISDWTPGVVRWFSDEQRYGWVVLDSGQEVHFRRAVLWMAGLSTISEGQPVDVRYSKDRIGLSAEEIRLRSWSAD